MSCISTDPHSPWRGERLRGHRKRKSAGCRRVSQLLLVSAGMRCPPPITPVLAGWLQGWAASACPRHPGGLAHPHWQCVDWQLGTELDSPHAGAVTQAVHLPLCAHSAWPVALSPVVLFRPSLPFFLSQGPDSELTSSFSNSSLEAVAAEVALDTPKKKERIVVPTVLTWQFPTLLGPCVQPRHLAQCQAHSRCSINGCRIEVN